MKSSTLRRSGGIAAVALSLSVGLAACGSSDSSTTGSAGSAPSSAAPAPSSSAPAPASSSPAAPESSSAGGASPAADTFGPACSAIPKTGKGSFTGMVTDPVGTAASNNPLLKTLVAAATAADLVGTLNSAPALTVFAPTDDAFKKIPAKDLKAVLADKATLTSILLHHVIGEKLTPDALVGKHMTLNKDTVTVAGDTKAGLTVDKKTASVICGNIPTANATVYVIDSVLMPTGK